MKKRFYHNGQYICDYESTGDEMKDIAIINQIAIERGLDFRTTTTAEAMFQQANSFAATGAALFERLIRRPPDQMAIAPFVVNTAFSLELYMKVLALQHGKKLHGHELSTLFRKLPGAAKQEIERQLAALCETSRWSAGIKTFSDLTNVTANLNTAFIDWRYSYEQPSRPLRIDFQPTIFLGEVLHAAIEAGFQSRTVA